MPITLPQFIDSLSTSGVMTSTEAEAACAVAEQSRPRQSPEALADELVRQGKLTRFQAKALLAGAVKGLVLDNYVLLELIGIGGVGKVFKAQHRRMKRAVALKILSASAMKSAEGAERFQREVEAAAKLVHPNIVTAYDADEQQGMAFLVMEYVDGRDLFSRVNRHGPLSLAMTIDCLIQAAQGLEYAHQQGVVHRDIKPSNLLLSREGVVKILDMGLARLDVGKTTGSHAGLTQFGQIMGTMEFMSPEQAEDTRKANALSDIYSLGCTFYSLLTGDYLYPGDTAMRVLMAHRESPIPSLIDSAPQTPRELDDLFRRMVAKAPGDRPRSMREVIEGLTNCRESHELLREPWIEQERKLLYHDRMSEEIADESEAEALTRPSVLASDSSLNFELDDSSDESLKQPLTRQELPARAKGKKDAPEAGKKRSPKPIEVRCSCGLRLAARKDLAGRTVACPKCKGSLKIPPLVEDSIRVRCECGNRLKANPQLAGKMVRCPRCSRGLRMPPLPVSPSSVQDKIVVQCRCRKRFAARPELAGKTVTCPHCGSALNVPAR